MVMIWFHGDILSHIPYTHPFQALGPISHEHSVITYPELSVTGKMSMADPSCYHGVSAIQHPININAYNPKSMRRLLVKYKQVTDEYPALGNSFLMLENYGAAAVKAVPEESTAFPHRQDNILM